MRRGVQALTMCTVLAGGTGIAVAAVVHSQTPIPTVNQTLISLLPGGTVQSWRPELTTRAGNAIDVIYDDGNGAALITGAVDHPDLPGGHSLSCDVATCTPLSDGSGYLALYQGNGDPNRPGSTGIEWEASVHRDNVVVTISEWNSDRPVRRPDSHRATVDDGSTDVDRRGSQLAVQLSTAAHSRNREIDGWVAAFDSRLSCEHDFRACRSGPPAAGFASRPVRAHGRGLAAGRVGSGVRW